jgi:hypothetical protein
MEYFNLRPGRCTSCLRHFDMKHLAGYDLIDASQRGDYMTYAGARLVCCRNHFMSPHAVTLTRQKAHLVFDTPDTTRITQPRGVCGLIQESAPLEKSKEIMMHITIPDNYPLPPPKESWLVVEGKVVFPNNADIPIIDETVFSDVVLPGQNITQGNILHTTREFTKRTYLIW